MICTFAIGNRMIGSGAAPYVIAEAGVNHNGDIEKAIALVDAAAAAGADAVKFQTFAASRLATLTAPKAQYQKQEGGVDESQYEMLRRLELSESAHQLLIQHASARGITFLSSPFDEESADLLEQLDVLAYKVPSGELTNLPLLRHIARKRRPMIVSTGMADLAEVSAAVSVIEEAGTKEVALLHCVSAYPAAPQDANLRAIATLARVFNLPAGWSDHMPGIDIAIAAAALGAVIIEKHITLDRRLPGPDHAASLEPDEFATMVASIRRVADALGTGEKQPTPAEAEISAVARKSLVARVDLPAGHPLSADDLTARRPGTGISPAQLDQLVGRRLRRAVGVGEPLSFEALQ